MERSASPRSPLGQLIAMVILVAFFSAIPAFVATALAAWIGPETPRRWYAVFLSPGLLPFALFSRSRHMSSLSDVESWLVFVINFVYYFGLLFAFVFWADRRWRRKRAPRIDA
jgi:hypothetical protein